MIKRRVFAALSASLLLSACGGDGGDDREPSREYGMLLQINGSTTISDKTITHKTLTRENYSSTLEDCLQTRTLTDGTSVEVPLYDNYESIGSETSDYCDGTLEYVDSTLVIQARFINNTYEEMPITYRGVGVEVRIYDENEVEVWNSIIAQDVANQSADLDPFDPFTTHSRTLTPGEAFPNQSNFPIGYTFVGNQNYDDFDNDPTTYQLENDFVGLGWQAGDLDHSASICEPAKQETGTTQWDPGNTERTRLYNKPLCQSVRLPAGEYRVRIEFSFTPVVDPVEFTVTINPEA